MHQISNNLDILSQTKFVHGDIHQNNVIYDGIKLLLVDLEPAFLQLKNGKNFAELAQQYSEGTESTLGGDLGLMRKDELLYPLAQALNDLKVGEMSKPVETELGIHILNLEEATPGKTLPFEEVKDSIKNNLSQACN